MLLLESQLRRVIFEEVQLYLFEHEQNIDEALKDDIRKWFLPRTQDSPELAAYKGETRREFGKTLWKAALVGTVIGTVQRFNAFAQAKDTAAYNLGIEKRKKKQTEYEKTDDYVIEALNDYLDNSINFQWAWGPQKHWVSATGKVSFPTEFPTLSDIQGTIIVLSADYGVWREVLKDFEEQKNRPNKQPTYTKEHIVQGSGTAEKWSKDFPKDWELPTDSAKCLKLGQTCKDLLSIAHEQGFQWDVPIPKGQAIVGAIYLPFDKIPTAMVLPNSGMTSTELYVHLWNKFVVKPTKTK